MRIVKTYEEYELDIDNGDISEEYAKAIISEYIDEIDVKKSQDIFDEYVESDEIEEEHREMIKSSILEILNKLIKDSVIIRFSDNYYLEKKANNYNL